MKMRSPIWFLWGVWVMATSFAVAGEAEVKASLQALATAAKEESAGKETPDGRMTSLALVANLQSLMVQGDFGQMYEVARNSLSYIAKGEKTSLAAQELLKVLPEAIQEQKIRQQNEMDAVLAAQGKALLAAKEPKEVDPIMMALQKAMGGTTGAYGRRYYDTNSLENAIRVAANWQDYLRTRKAGQTKEAQNHLRQIQDSVIRIPQFVPRSMVGDLMDELSMKNPEVEPTQKVGEDALKRAQELINACKSTKNIPKLYEALAELPMTPGERGNYGGLFQQVTKLRNAQQSLQTGDLDAAMNSLRRSGNEVQEVAFLRNALELEALPYYMEQPGFPILKGDSVHTLIERMIREAIKKNQWSAVYRGLHAYRVFGSSGSSGNYPPGINDDISAVGSLLSGYNHERAGQWTPAVRYYLSALRSAKEVDVVPFISERLKEIETNQPEAYKAGANPEPVARPGYYPYAGQTGAMPGMSRNEAAVARTDKPDYLPPGPINPAKTPEAPTPKPAGP